MSTQLSLSTGVTEGNGNRRRDPDSPEHGRHAGHWAACQRAPRTGRRTSTANAASNNARAEARRLHLSCGWDSPGPFLSEVGGGMIPPDGGRNSVEQR
jgi:hypothetical protein